MALNVLAPSNASKYESHRLQTNHKPSLSNVYNSQPAINLNRNPSDKVPLFENPILNATTANHHKHSSTELLHLKSGLNISNSILECKGRYITPKIMVMKKPHSLNTSMAKVRPKISEFANIT